jgi:uncharacterized lipoprotein YmbA
LGSPRFGTFSGLHFALIVFTGRERFGYDWQRRNPLHHEPGGKIVAVFLGVCLYTLGGCANSKPARFYTLDPLGTSAEHTKSISAEQGIAIAIGPVAIPDYLNRPQILSRSGSRERKLAEFDRWAGSLEQDISRVLAENLSVLLSKDHVTVLRRGQVVFPFPVEYGVGVDVLRFEGAIGESVILEARWSVHREGDRKILSARESIVREPVEGDDYDALVGAMSRALATLSREIASAIPAR